MQCQICKKNDATIHLTEIVEGVRTEMHICSYCASEQGIIVKSNIPINELLSNLLSSEPSDEEIFGKSKEQLVCPNCGFTLEQFGKEAVLGCPSDYEIFEKALEPLIAKAHAGKTMHCGKVPSRMPIESKQQIELMQLRQKLDEAVKAEDYETAAKLRDKIADVEK